MNIKGNDYFMTPVHVFEQLDKIFNFNLDPCADDDNHLCKNYYKDTPYCGLSRPWGHFKTFKDGYRVFCNPPFSNKADWIKKAHDEVMFNHCPVVVMVLPTNCLDSKAWHEYIEGKFHYEILRGRVSFIDPETLLPKSGNNSGTVIVYFKKKIVR